MSAKEMDKGLKVIKLTQIATWVLIVVTAVADVFGYYICKYVWSQIVVGWDQFRPITNEAVAFPMLIALFYVGTLFAYVILFNMLKLLDNMKASKVFIKDNTKLMKNMSVACIAIFAICFVAMLVWPSLLFVGIIGLFMGLIVQCVRVVMDKAIDMRDELDYTV